MWFDFKESRKKQSSRRKTRLKYRIDKLMELQYEPRHYLITQKGYDAFLVNGFLLLYLVHNTYKNLKNHETGSYFDLKKFVKEYINKYDDVLYTTYTIEGPKLPSFKFLMFRPKLRRFLDEYRKYLIKTEKVTNIVYTDSMVDKN